MAIAKIALFVLAMLVAVRATAEPAAAHRVEFSRDIRPLLSNTCFKCHGPDDGQRQAELRLDQQEGAVAELPSGQRAIVPGKREESELYRRLVSDDPAARMPPSEEGKSLSAEQIELFGRWIDQGAEFRAHWSFVPPARPEPPAVKNEAWCRTPLDRFVLARLEEAGLRPEPAASRETLLRRVTFDLTGLPPTLEEIDDFLLDNSADAYERAVERLLASPRFGEHFAREWLDAARYGDTHGLHLDNERAIWPYRDWVIGALNRNLPFDQFALWQVAGDLLPQPTLEQRVATGFNRCNVSTSEGGSIDEEFRVRYAVDRVEAIGTVFLGLTLNCTVCHDHKYDPITQREFYQLFAYYNNVADKAMDGNAIDPPPVIRVPGRELAERLAAAAREREAAEAAQQAASVELAEAQRAWEHATQAELERQWQVLAPSETRSQSGSKLSAQGDGSLLVHGENPPKDVYEIVAALPVERLVALRLECLTDPSLVEGGPGRSSNANFVLSEIELSVVPAGATDGSDGKQEQPIKLARAEADYSQKDFHIEQAIDGRVEDSNGWAPAGFERHEPRVAVFFPAQNVAFPEGSLLRVRLRQESQFAGHGIGRLRLAVSASDDLLPARWGAWSSVGPFANSDAAAVWTSKFGPEAAFDLSAKYGERGLRWAPRPFQVDGRAIAWKEENSAMFFARRIVAPTPRRELLRLGSDDGVRVWLNGQLLLERQSARALKPGEEQVALDLRAGENVLLVEGVNYGAGGAVQFERPSGAPVSDVQWLAPVLNRDPAQRTAAQQQAITDVFLRQSPRWQQLVGDVARLKSAEEELLKQAPLTMVMEDAPTQREAFVLIRGQYDKPGEQVKAGTPASLPPLPPDAPPTRLALARWLIDPGHPLTARVTVNRYWQHYFGVGLVKTAEDFGSQGEWPSNPELLDYLATWFIDHGWDVKALQRLIVTSAVYRQSSSAAREKFDHDPENRLLARGPRFRFDAEVLRDMALSIGGLLSEEIGGHGVKPYQPAGLWEAVAYPTSNTANFVQDQGTALYRRSLYTFWKRTSPPPSMMNFDAPSREACTVRRARTNTPTQALTLMNDIQFVEAARQLAAHVLVSESGSDHARVRLAFRLVTGREPEPSETRSLLAVLGRNVEAYRADAAAADALLDVGDSPSDAALDRPTWAAWTMLCNLLLNLDETMTKG